MENSELILFIIKLVFGGIAAFLAILLWSKTRDPAWMCVIGGIVIAYAGVVVDMMSSMGMVSSQGLTIAGISFLSLIFSIVPSIFFIIAFIIKIHRSA